MIFGCRKGEEVEEEEELDETAPEAVEKESASPFGGDGVRARAST